MQKTKIFVYVTLVSLETRDVLVHERRHNNNNATYICNRKDFTWRCPPVNNPSCHVGQINIRCLITEIYNMWISKKNELGYKIYSYQQTDQRHDVKFGCKSCIYYRINKAYSGGLIAEPGLEQVLVLMLFAALCLWFVNPREVLKMIV